MADIREVHDESILGPARVVAVVTAKVARHADQLLRFVDQLPSGLDPPLLVLAHPHDHVRPLESEGHVDPPVVLVDLSCVELLLVEPREHVEDPHLSLDHHGFVLE